MKILITGAAGMLAADLASELITQGHAVIKTDIHQRLSDIQKLDVSSLKEVLAKINNIKPDYVFHLAAKTNVDLCEKEPDHAFLINTIGTENMALACQEFNLPLLYISTAAVFNGSKDAPYTEFDVPNPVNTYGESKFQGERIVKSLLSKYFIFRAGWMIGGWEIDKKFVYKIIQQLKEGKKELKAVSDKFGSPTFTKDFSKNVMPVINAKRYGIYHIANKGTCSRYELAIKIIEFMGLSSKVRLDPVSSDLFPLPAKRADSEMIRNYKLDLMGLNNMPHWEKSLKEYIDLNKNK